MTEESKSGGQPGELDLSNLDALLGDLEKELDAGPAAVPAAPASSSAEIPAPVLAPPEPTEPEESVDEVLASPVSPAEKDIESDDSEDMFTDDEEPVGRPVDETVETIEASAPPATTPSTPTPPAQPNIEPVIPPPPAQSKPAPAPEEPAPAAGATASPTDDIDAELEALLAEPAEPMATPVVTPQAAVVPEPAAAPEEISFEDALDIEPESPAPVPSGVDVVQEEIMPTTAGDATTGALLECLRMKQYARAADIGRALCSSNDSDALRVNLAGALYLSGHADEAVRELQTVIRRSPYHITARRNLEFIRSAGA